MEVPTIIEEAGHFLGQARTWAYTKNFDRAAERLVQLRELLNAHPEIEAGGATESPDTPAEPERIVATPGEAP